VNLPDQRQEVNRMRAAKKTQLAKRRKPYTKRFNQVVSVPRSALRAGDYGFPASMKVRLKYADLIKLSATTVTQFKVYACNNIFKPDVNSTGHQPMYHDQYEAVYDQYQVISSKLTVKFNGGAGVGTNQPIVGVNKDNTVVGTASLLALMEQNQGNFKILSPKDAGGLSTITSTFSALKDLSVNISDKEYATTIGTGPSANNAMFWNIWIYGNDGIITASAVDCTIEIEYYILYSKLKEQLTTN